MRLLFAMTLSAGAALSTAAHAHPGAPGHRHVAVVHAPIVVVPRAPRYAIAPARRAAPYCATYGCSGSVTHTGPQGNTVTRSGETSCADGTCTRTRSIDGPDGGGGTFTRTISR